MRAARSLEIIGFFTAQTPRLRHPLGGHRGTSGVSPKLQGWSWECHECQFLSWRLEGAGKDRGQSRGSLGRVGKVSWNSLLSPFGDTRGVQPAPQPPQGLGQGRSRHVSPGSMKILVRQLLARCHKLSENHKSKIINLRVRLLRGVLQQPGPCRQWFDGTAGRNHRPEPGLGNIGLVLLIPELGKLPGCVPVPLRGWLLYVEHTAAVIKSLIF